MIRNQIQRHDSFCPHVRHNEIQQAAGFGKQRLRFKIGDLSFTYYRNRKGELSRARMDFKKDADGNFPPSMEGKDFGMV